MNISGDIIFVGFSLLVLAVGLSWGAVLGVLWNDRKHKLHYIAQQIAAMNQSLSQQRYRTDEAQATPQRRRWKPIMEERIDVENILEFLAGVAADPNREILQIHRLDGDRYYTVFLKEWEE